MKKITFFALAVLMLGSCSKKSTVGPAPTAPARDQFLGNWIVSEKSTAAHAGQYTVTIVEAPENSSQVAIINFYYLTAMTITATVSGDSIIIPNQTVDGYIVFGTGFNGKNGSITMSYEVVSASTGAVIAIYGYDGNPYSVW